MKKKILFVTGTRADFGKMRSIILTLIKTNKFKVDVFVTGMHLMKEYGHTIEEIKKVGKVPTFSFEPLSHYKLGSNLNLMDFEIIDNRLGLGYSGFKKFDNNEYEKYTIKLNENIQNRSEFYKSFYK